MKINFKDYLPNPGGKQTKNATEVGAMSKACDGHDHDGNDELGLKHPFSEYIDAHVCSTTESVIYAIEVSYMYMYVNKKSFEHHTSSSVRCRYGRK